MAYGVHVANFVAAFGFWVFDYLVLRSEREYPCSIVTSTVLDSYLYLGDVARHKAVYGSAGRDARRPADGGGTCAMRAGHDGTAACHRLVIFKSNLIRC